jgi:HEAT repeat protein
MSVIQSLVLGLAVVWPGADPEPPLKADPVTLREALYDSQQPRRQSQAALLLVQSSSPEVAAIVRQGLKQTDSPEVFLALADAVRSSQDGRFVEELASGLASGSAVVRQAAAECLAALPGTDLVRRLRAIADDPRADLAMRQAAVLSLGRNGRRQAVIALLDLLSSDNEAIRRTAAGALANVTGQSYGVDLDKWRNWWERHKDQSEERWLEERLAFQAARSMRLESDLDRARAQVVRLHQQLYARLPAAERLGYIQSIIEADEPAVRGMAVAWALESLPNADALGQRTLADVLLRLSRDGAFEVQRAAVLALGSLSDLRAPDRLRSLLRDPSAPLRAAAVRALAQQARGTGTETTPALRKQIVPLLQHALSDPALEVVVEAAEDLGALGVPEACPVLTGLLRHPSESVRQAAAQALERVADPTVFDYLVAALSDPAAKVRFSLVGALGHAAGDGRTLSASQREQLVSRLEAILLHDLDSAVRSRAATVLGECALPSILPTLWGRVLATEDSRVQEKAWGAIIEVLARTADFALVMEWDRKLVEAKQGPRRLQLLSELLARWQKRDDARLLLTSTEELLVPAQLEQGKWAAAFPLVRDLLAQPGMDAEQDRRLRWLLTVGEQALKDGQRAEAQRVVQEAEPFLPGRDALSGEFQKLDQRSK